VPVAVTPHAPAHEPTAESVPERAPADKSPLLLGEVKVSDLQREPQLTARVTFLAIGSSSALQSRLLCAYAVRCGEAFDSGERTETCLTLGEMRAIGTLNVALPGPAPAGGACTVDVWLSDGESVRSNRVTVPLS
jgi:hypothetical protein